MVPDYTGEVLFVSTDAQATTPGQYTFRPQDQGIALFLGGVTFRTPGLQALLVLDTATFSVFGFALFDVQAPFTGGGRGSVPAFDLFAGQGLGGAPVRRPADAAAVTARAAHHAAAPPPEERAAPTERPAGTSPAPRLGRVGAVPRAVLDHLFARLDERQPAL